ncbi:MAG TPA: hypothetical protein VFP84_36450 [Kofleriaceae bacterium]|nr:hypothetical protein [Kofleriaceae bacterium]
MTRRGVIIGAGALGGLGAIGLAIGFVVAPRQAAFSYLTAWAYALSIALGALIFLMIGHAVGARWTILFQRFTEAITGALPVLAVLFAPIALALPRLYPWVAPSGALDPEVATKLAHKAPYLNAAFWLTRAVIFFAVWIAIGELLVYWGRRSAHGRARALSAAGLPAIALTLTFAAFDWLMSLTPLWYSTVFGLLYFSGGFVAALALIAVVASVARRVPAVAAHVRPSHTGALGRLMFAFLVFWAYMELSQGLITWIANRPDEVPWYVARGAGAWGDTFAVLVIGHFALPFLVLLSKPLKRRPALLAIAGAWLVAMHYVDVYWLIMPVLHATLAIHWLDVAAPLGVLGVTVAIAAWRARSPLASEDPRFAAAAAYEGS